MSEHIEKWKLVEDSIYCSTIVSDIFTGKEGSKNYLIYNYIRNSFIYINNTLSNLKDLTNVEFAFAKIDLNFRIDILVGVPEKVFNDEKFLIIYDWIWEQESGYADQFEDSAMLNFSFVGINEYLDKSLIHGDGYILEYQV